MGMVVPVVGRPIGCLLVGQCLLWCEGCRWGMDVVYDSTVKGTLRLHILLCWFSTVDWLPSTRKHCPGPPGFRCQHRAEDPTPGARLVDLLCP